MLFSGQSDSRKQATYEAASAALGVAAIMAVGGQRGFRCWCPRLGPACRAGSVACGDRARRRASGDLLYRRSLLPAPACRLSELHLRGRKLAEQLARLSTRVDVLEGSRDEPPAPRPSETNDLNREFEQLRPLGREARRGIWPHFTAAAPRTRNAEAARQPVTAGCQPSPRILSRTDRVACG